ncbi:MAG: serine/threonine protein kinase, partial [Planctomycetia bacterium]|nr:serine/threonine protein kinase [Planctomycetia bacterium]
MTPSSMVGRTYLGLYETVRPLGEGNMGKVYLARRKSDGAPVVVKVMHDHLTSDPKFRELFEREMQFMARLKHPNIIELLDASARDPKSLCIVMEYADGIDLERLLKKHRRFPVDRVGRWVGQLCGALAAAHAHGVIHRDLKPANMMVVEPGTPKERIKVMDFGLAKLSGSVHISLDKLKGDGGTIATGTAEYMAPEQVRGDELDHRSDLYAVGVIMFELLTGRLPFSGANIHALLQAHAEEPAPKFAEVGAGGVVSPAIEAVVQRCMLKFAVERFNNAWELGQAFEKALGEKIMEGPAPPPPQKAAPPPAAKKKPHDPNAVVHELEAWMPERIAVVKLKGYVDDMHGEVVESVGGKIRVHFGQPNCKYQFPGAKATSKSSSGIGGWFGLGGGAPKTKGKL